MTVFLVFSLKLINTSAYCFFFNNGSSYISNPFHKAMCFTVHFTEGTGILFPNSTIEF